MLASDAPASADSDRDLQLCRPGHDLQLP